MLLLFALALSAQNADSPIRVDTRLVQLNVLARDRNGPVRGLVKEDFVVTEKGKKRTIAAFSAHERTLEPTQDPVLPPGVFSNLYRGSAGGVTVIFFDALSMDPESQMFARRETGRFLESLRPSDRVGVYVLGQTLQVAQDFHSNAASLIQALKRQKLENRGDGAGPPRNTEGPNLLPEWTSTLNEIGANLQSVERIGRTLEALRQIAQHLHSVPGRKNLIWISGGFPLSFGLNALSSPGSSLSQGVYSLEIHSVTRALNEANAAVYPIYVPGLAPLTFRQRESAAPAATLGKYETGTLSLRILADETGGVATTGSNDPAGAMRKALDDTEVNYVLGFYTGPEETDGKFHDIKVDVRRKGVDVRTRRGYLAAKDTPVVETRRLAELGRLLASPLDATAIQVGMRTSADSADTIHAQVMIDASQIRVEDREGRKTGAVDVVLDLQSAGGKSLSQASRTLHLNLTEANYRKVLDQSLQTAMQLPGHKDAAQLRLVVLDRLTGSAGSATGKWPILPTK
jgi:VWFA-related protein